MLDKALEEYHELKLVYSDKESYFHASSFQIFDIHILRQEYDQARQELANYLSEVPPKPNHESLVQSYRAHFFITWVRYHVRLASPTVFW